MTSPAIDTSLIMARLQQSEEQERFMASLSSEQIMMFKNLSVASKTTIPNLIDAPIPTHLPIPSLITTFVVEDISEDIVHSDDDEDDSILRPRLLCKPCQGGKTGEALRDWIIEQSRTIAASSSEVRKLAFFVCDNSLLLTKQTEIRAKSDDIQIEGDIIIISCKDTIKCAAKLFTAIIDNSKISTILCCGNARRLKDISELSNRLKKMATKYEISIYIDEADKILNSKSAKEQVTLWRQQSTLVKHLLLITATPYESATKNLVEDYGEIELLPVQMVTREDYHKFSDSHHIDTSNIHRASNTDYIAEVFDEFIPEGPNLGDVYFVPAERTTNSHDELQKLLFDLGFNCVIKINGKNKEISILNDTSVDPIIIPFTDINKELTGTSDSKFMPSNNELSRWLGNYYLRNNGQDKWVMAITGNICISRGISIQSPECLITHAIYGPHCSNSKAGKYQMYARVCGNICNFPKYIETRGPIVYCSKKEFDETCRMEQFAINLGTLSQSNGSNGHIIVDSDKITELFDATEKFPVIFCGTDMRRSYIDLVPFHTKEEAIASIQQTRPNWSPHRNFMENIDGFIEGAQVRYSGTKVASWDEYKKEVRWGAQSSVPQRIQPCYLDTTDATTLRWATWVYAK